MGLVEDLFLAVELWRCGGVEEYFGNKNSYQNLYSIAPMIPSSSASTSKSSESSLTSEEEPSEFGTMQVPPTMPNVLTTPISALNPGGNPIVFYAHPLPNGEIIDSIHFLPVNNAAPAACFLMIYRKITGPSHPTYNLPVRVIHNQSISIYNRTEDGSSFYQELEPFQIPDEGTFYFGFSAYTSLPGYNHRAQQTTSRPVSGVAYGLNSMNNHNQPSGSNMQNHNINLNIRGSNRQIYDQIYARLLQSYKPYWTPDPPGSMLYCSTVTKDPETPEEFLYPTNCFTIAAQLRFKSDDGFEESTTSSSKTTSASPSPHNTSSFHDESRLRFNTTSLAHLLQCSICTGTILHSSSAVQTRCCQQLYCKSCIIPVLKSKKPCPKCKNKFFTLIKLPKIFSNLIDIVTIQCKFQTSGCQENVHISNLLEHQETCPFSFQACEYCQAPFLRSVLRQHQQCCSYRTIKCPKCSELVPEITINNGTHLLFCVGINVTCPQCKNTVIKRDLPHHIKSCQPR